MGLKVFKICVVKVNDNIVGKGYLVIFDEKLILFFELLFGVVFNVVEQVKYWEFKEECVGFVDYMVMEGEFVCYLEDVYFELLIECEVLIDECEILVVGVGFVGFFFSYKLKEVGFEDVCFCEKGGDVGGIWYWNCYLGIVCDVEVYLYLLLFEEMGYIFFMCFVLGFEIMEYCQQMVEKFGFYDKCFFYIMVE